MSGLLNELTARPCCRMFCLGHLPALSFGGAPFTAFLRFQRPLCHLDDLDGIHDPRFCRPWLSQEARLEDFGRMPTVFGRISQESSGNEQGARNICKRWQKFLQWLSWPLQLHKTGKVLCQASSCVSSCLWHERLECLHFSKCRCSQNANDGIHLTPARISCKDWLSGHHFCNYAST